MSDLTAAIERLEAGLASERRTLVEHTADLHAVIAAAKRTIPTDDERAAARAEAERVGFNPRTLGGQGYIAGYLVAIRRQPERPDLADATVRSIEKIINDNLSMIDLGRAAKAILAEYRVGVTTRERLAEALFLIDIPSGLTWAQATALTGVFNEAEVLRYRNRAASILASGAVEDRAEVEVKALEAAADALRETARLAQYDAHDRNGMNADAAWLRARAARIREAGGPRVTRGMSDAHGIIEGKSKTEEEN